MLFTPTRTVRRTVLPLAALVLVLAGCSSGAAATSTTVAQPAPGSHQPIATTTADWGPVTAVLARTGKFGDNSTVYRIR